MTGSLNRKMRIRRGGVPDFSKKLLRAGINLLGLLLVSASLIAQQLPPKHKKPTLVVPRVQQAPALADFLEMKPNVASKGQLAKVKGFIQRSPRDGEPATQRTEVYLGYDDKNLYAVFVCFDSEPEKVRARMNRREDVFGDDLVEIMIDTFNDQCRAYALVPNPFGIQWEALWTEGQGFDGSFDTLWQS